MNKQAKLNRIHELVPLIAEWCDAIEHQSPTFGWHLEPVRTHLQEIRLLSAPKPDAKKPQG